MRRLLLLLMLLLTATCAHAKVQMVTYTDPGSVFTLQIPDTWKAHLLLCSSSAACSIKTRSPPYQLFTY